MTLLEVVLANLSSWFAGVCKAEGNLNSIDNTFLRLAKDKENTALRLKLYGLMNSIGTVPYNDREFEQIKDFVQQTKEACKVDPNLCVMLDGFLEMASLVRKLRPTDSKD